MKKIVFLFLLFPAVLHAEDVAMYDGETYLGCRNIGNTNVFLDDPNDYGTVKDGFIYLPNGCASIPQVAPKYLKQDGGSIVEMNTIEKAAVDILESNAEQARQIEAHNAIVDQAKAEVDNPKTIPAMLNTCISAITTDEIREIKKGSPRQGKTDEQLRQVVKSCLETFKK